MKFTAPRELLAHEVAWAARTLPARPVKPILSGIRIEADDTGLRLSAYDMATSARIEITEDVDVDTPGVIVVPGKVLSDMLAALPGESVTFTLDGSTVTVRSGAARYALNSMPTEDFPPLPALPTSSGVVTTSQFAQAVRQVTVAVAKDESLPVLVNVVVALTPTTITLSATDRYRVSRVTIPWTSDLPADTTVYVQGRALAETVKAMAATKEPTIRLAVGAEGHLAMTSELRAVTVQLNVLDYPQIDKLFPTGQPISATTNRADLLAAVRRAALVTERGSHLRLAFDTGSVDVSSTAGEGRGSDEQVEALLEGPPVEVAFNPSFLIDALDSLTTDHARFRFVDARKPALITGVDESGEELDTWDYLLVPIRLPS